MVIVALRTESAARAEVRFAEIAKSPAHADCSTAQTAVPKASRNAEAGETPLERAMARAAWAPGREISRALWNWAVPRPGFAAGRVPGACPSSAAASRSSRSPQYARARR
jgi:hypothetical protein